MALLPRRIALSHIPVLLGVLACQDAVGPNPNAVRAATAEGVNTIVSIPAGSDATIEVGQTAYVTSTLSSSSTIGYHSSNPSVAYFKAPRELYGAAVGTAQMILIAGDQEEWHTVRVVPAGSLSPSSPPSSAVGSVAITASTTSIAVGASVQLSATVRDTTGHPMTGQTVIWSTSSATIAKIGGDGTVTGVAQGSATITAASGGKSASVTLNVTTGTTSTPTDEGGPVPVSGPATPAALPRSTVDSRYVAPTGRTIQVPSGGDLQGAINSAQRGDLIILPAGAVYVGSFTLPAKSGTAANGWITIRTATPDGSFPAQGTRVAPRHASLMPRIMTPDYRPALRIAPGASGWRIVGIELTVSGSFGGQQYGVIHMGQGDEPSTSAMATDVIVDRSYVHGQPNVNVMRCVAMNGIRMAVIDSWLADCHDSTGDSQAIAGWNGPGPFLIRNNYLEAAGENVIFGGSDPTIDGLVPSDIEIVGNHFFKPLTWKGGRWVIKNLLELKNAQRVLVEGNVFQNSWAAAQDGWAFIWASHNQYGGRGAWSVVQDITFRFNRVDNVEGVFNLAERFDGTAASAARFTITHNLLTNVGLGDSGDLDRIYLVSGNLADVSIEHNTGFAPTAFLQFGDTYAIQKPRFSFRNNVGGNARYTYNSPRGDGSAMFTAYGVPLSAVVGNCVVTSEASIMPPSNIYPSTLSLAGLLSAVGFSGDYRLGTSSPCAGRATDGTNPGANIAAVMDKTAGAIVAP